MNKKSILIIDDEEIILHTLRSALTDEGYLVDTAVSGEEGIRKFNANKHDLVITDLIMEKIDGIEVARIIKEKKPSTKVIVLTGYGSQNTAIESLRLGVSDYFLKPYNKKELCKKVETCLNELNDSSRESNRSSNIDEKLKQFRTTARENEVIHLIAKGKTNGEIATSMFITPSTVRNHLKNIHTKLGVHNRTQLLAKLHEQIDVP